ncbi:MAG: DUF3810 domain-containing protein [Oscillospiraceae bacterium]
MIFGAVLLVFHYIKNDKALMDWWTTEVMTPFRQWVADICEPLSITLAEFMWLIGICLLTAIVTEFIVRLARKAWKKAAQLFMFTVDAVLVLTILAHMTWGAYYYGSSFQEKSGVYAEEATVSDLYLLTIKFAMGANRESLLTERNDDGTISFDVDEILDESKTSYDAVSEIFPCLEGRDVRAKALAASEIWSYLNTTGITFPYTGECCINVDQPECMIPATIEHEIAHQRGVASEQEANFLAIVSCLESSDSVYRYSGYLMGFIHLSNALYKVNTDLWRQAYNVLNDYAAADIVFNNSYWSAHKTTISRAHDKAYDSYLKNYDQDMGMQSYGAVVDLLISYYLNSGNEV